jgi:opacity protein-like surface antigen
VIVQGGPLAIDVGYRYKRILAGGAVSQAFTLGGGAYEVNQVRVGIGFRF